MTLVLGVEAGGSHCHALVADPSGTILGVGANRDSGNWEDVGIVAAGGALRACVRAAFDAATRDPDEVAAGVFALAGVDFAIDEERLGGLPEAMGVDGPTWIMNDAFAALRAGTTNSYGVVVAAGTGSVVAGQNMRGEQARTLGLGPTFGDSGSASEVSEGGVTAVAMAFLGRGPDTALTEMMCAAAGAASVEDFLEGTARGRLDAAVYAPVVASAAQAGDAVALGVLRAAGESLGHAAGHVIRRLGMEGSSFEVVLAGGLWRAGAPVLREAFEEVVRTQAAGAEPVLLDAPPVIGSALLALELSGATPDGAVRGRLAEAARQWIVGVPS
ncbi:MAG TPA: BadF/BadG/BcrA/BcrD ATPase family protein [Actinomycetota bacterium]|jgi:N-acetylglucosamine kinase-like BadF-type ATPase